MKVKLLFTLILISLPLQAKQEFYIATDGSDRNPGTIEKPFATLEKARDAVRKLQPLKEPVHIYLKEGRYFLDKTFVLTEKDSGTEKYPIVYQSFQNEEVIISGGRIIKGWKRLKEQPDGIDPNAAGKLWVVDIEKGWFPHFLFVDGQSQRLARFPNDGFLEGDEGIQAFGNPSPKGQLITFPDSIKKYMPYLPSNGDVEMSWIPILWANGISVMRDFDVQANTVWRHSKNVLYKGNPNKDWMRGNRFRLQNALCLIDQPGEWAVDTQKGKLYIWPQDEAINDKEVIASKLYELVRIEGDEPNGKIVHDIQIRDLTFMHTDRMPEDIWPDEWLKRNFENPDAAIFLKDTERITVEGIRIIHVGTYGITLNHYAQNNRIIANEIAYTGCGGVQLLGYGPGTKDVNRKNIIHRNLIHHCGASDYMHSGAISVYQSGHNQITYNYIYQMPFSGVMIVSAHYTHLNDIARHGWSEEHDKPYLHTDAYGQWEPQYQVRWDELPQGTYERMMKGEGVFKHRIFVKYLHSGNNLVAYNIASKCMQGLADGGALNPFGCGENNQWKFNIVHQSKDKAIYLDTASDYTHVEGNCSWGSGGTINTIWDGRNTWKDNHFGWTERPLHYNELFDKIVTDVQAQGGWPGQINVPAPTLAISSEHGKIFFDNTAVRIERFVDKGNIFYAIDGNEPTPQSTRYTKQIELDETTTVKAAVFHKDKQVGETDTITFTKVDEPVNPDLYLRQDPLHNEVTHFVRYASYRYIDYDSEQFQVLDRKFVKGMPMYKHDQIICPIQPNYDRFVAMIGVDDLSDIRGFTIFQVLIDDKVVFESDKMTLESIPYNIDIEIPEGSKELVLKAKEFSDFYWVYGDWINAGFITKK